jgi:membrane protease YdiL (CAAX protease family)
VTNALLSALLQVAVFTLVPLVTYLVTRKKLAGFLEYIGLVRPTGRSMVIATLFAAATMVVFAVVLSLFPGLRDSLGGTGTAAGRVRDLGLNANGIGHLLVGAVIQTSLSEEILFRGFVAKRLIERMGFRWGNVLQAAIFAAPHLLLLLVPEAHVSAAAAIGLFVYPFAMGLVLAWLNEKVGNGSIVPGWWAHALGNVGGYALMAFG